MLRQRLDQSVSLLASQEAHAPPGFLQHPNLRHPFEPSPVLMRDIQYPPNYLECAIDRRVRDTILQFAIANERLQHRHVDRIELTGPKKRIEFFQMILILREAPLIRELLKISHDRLLPYENVEEPLLLCFKRFVLQADDVAFGIGAIDTPSALAYAASIRENEANPPEPRVLAAVDSYLDRIEKMLRKPQRDRLSSWLQFW